MRSAFLFLLICVAAFHQAAAQHAHDFHSRYAMQKQSHIPSITMEEFGELQAGEGMGLAKPAELNHYPGPKHVLAMADSLGLSEAQRTKIEAIRQTMSTNAMRLGQEYLHAEHELNMLFSEGRATDKVVVQMTQNVEERRAALRAAHLLAHVETRNALTPAQIERYDQLRGYLSN